MDQNPTSPGPHERYNFLFGLINQERQTLLWTDTLFLVANLVLHMFLATIVCLFPEQLRLTSTHQEIVLLPLNMVIALVAIGITLCGAWVTHSLRLQLKLKLHYFQTRSLESTFEDGTFAALTDEGRFFGNRVLESPDGKEKLVYPKSLDGFMARSRQRIWTWFLPMMFFLGYLYALFYLIVLSQ